MPFEYLLKCVQPLITKRDTDMRKAISVKIEIILRYLTIGDSLKSLEFSHSKKYNKYLYSIYL